MFKREDPKPTRLEETIDKMLVELQDTPFSSEEAMTIVTHVTKLTEAQATLKGADRPKVSADVLATVVGNLAGIGMIISYERFNVITSKALSFVSKPKA